MSRIPFEQLVGEVRQAVADKAGAVHGSVTAPGGMNSGVASVLDTDSGPVFVKGIRTDHPQVSAQRREAAVAPHLPPSCPRLFWHLELDGWSFLGHEAVDGRHADYAPGSPDLPLVEAALAELQGITAPPGAGTSAHASLTHPAVWMASPQGRPVVPPDTRQCDVKSLERAARGRDV